MSKIEKINSNDQCLSQKANARYIDTNHLIITQNETNDHKGIF